MKTWYLKRNSIIRLFIYGLMIVIIYIGGRSFMDKISLCPIYLVTGYKCFGCGMTRAFIHAMHFDFAGAYKFNPLVVFYFPTAVILFLLDVILSIKSLLKK